MASIRAIKATTAPTIMRAMAQSARLVDAVTPVWSLPVACAAKSSEHVNPSPIISEKSCLNLQKEIGKSLSKLNSAASTHLSHSKDELHVEMLASFLRL